MGKVYMGKLKYVKLGCALVVTQSVSQETRYTLVIRCFFFLQLNRLGLAAVTSWALELPVWCGPRLRRISRGNPSLLAHEVTQHIHRITTMISTEDILMDLRMYSIEVQNE